jgi:hypothetical protein
MGDNIDLDLARKRLPVSCSRCGGQRALSLAAQERI